VIEPIVDVNNTEPWGIYFKAKPDANGMFHTNQLPSETYEPPPSPKGRLREEINFLTIDLQYHIKNKILKKLPLLIEKAYMTAPSELEVLICHAELLLK